MLGTAEGDSQDDLDCSASSVLQSVCLNRSGLARSTIKTSEVAIQTDSCCPDRPKLRVMAKNATEEVKSACAQSQQCVECLWKLLGDVCK